MLDGTKMDKNHTFRKITGEIPEKIPESEILCGNLHGISCEESTSMFLKISRKFPLIICAWMPSENRRKILRESLRKIYGRIL